MGWAVWAGTLEFAPSESSVEILLARGLIVALAILSTLAVRQRAWATIR